MAQRIAKRPTAYIVKLVGYTHLQNFRTYEVCKKEKCHAVSILFVIQRGA